MSNPAFTATQGTVIKSPDGVEWHIGEKVLIWDADYHRTATLSDYMDGSWEFKDDAAVAAYFGLDDGWRVRPHLLVKLSEAPVPHPSRSS